jgi:hypothetical protein
MEIKFAKTKKDLPEYNLECSICFDNIDLDEVKDGVPNCVMCNNGHRIHTSCYNKLHTRECPMCREKTMKYCKCCLGYGYVERKGGKKRKTNKKRKTHKKRKTYKKV